jgi:hypothetical protein
MKFILLFLITFFIGNVIFAQETFNYQANILTKTGLPAANRSINVVVKISNDSNFISSSYEENVQVVSDKFGYITFEIGKNPITIPLSNIDWTNNTYISLDINTTDEFENLIIKVKHKINFAPKSIYSLYATNAKYAEFTLWSAKTDSSLYAVNSDTTNFSKTGAWALKTDSAKHAINADTSQYNFVSQWSAKTDSAKHAVNADTSQYNFVSQWSAKSDSAKHAINADTSQYNFVSQWSAKSDSAKHAVNADTSQYNFVSKWSAKSDSAKHAINADTSQYTFVSQWSAKSDSAEHAINADTSQYNFVSQWSAKADSAKHAINADTSQYNFVSKWSAKSDSAKHAVNADTSQYTFVSKWSAKSDSAKHAINADTSQYNFVSKWSAKSDSAKHAINADTSQYTFVSKWSAKSDSAKHAINADTSQYNFVSKWSAKSDSAKHAVNADTSQYNFVSQWSAKSDSAKHAVNADTSQYNFVSQWSAKSDSAKHAVNADTSQYNFVSQWSAKSDSAKHAVNADTSQYNFVSQWSAKSDSAKHAVNADTSQYNFVSQWSAKSDSAKHAVNADTSQYNFVSQWSAKSDSAKHAVNADTSQYNFVSQWSAKTDSAKHAVNADTSHFAFNIKDSSITNSKFAEKIIASKLLGTDIDTVGTIKQGIWSANPIADSVIVSSAYWNAKQEQLSGNGYVKLNGSNITYDSSTFVVSQDSITQNAKFKIDGTGTANSFKLNSTNQLGLISKDLAALNIQQINAGNNYTDFNATYSFIGHNLWYDGYSFVRRDKRGKGNGLLLNGNTITLIQDTTTAGLINDNTIIPVQYGTIYSSFNIDTNNFKKFVPLDLLGNSAVTFIPQPTNINSGMAGLRINKNTNLHHNPHGFMFSVDDSTKWDLGMDYENEDFVLAYNHNQNHKGDFIRMAENNRMIFGTGIGTPKYNFFKYTFTTDITDSLGLGGMKIQTLSNLDTALNTNGVFAGSKAFFTSNVTSQEFVQAGMYNGKARITSFFNNTNFAQFVNAQQANSNNNYGFMQNNIGELFIGGTNLNVNSTANFSGNIFSNNNRVLTTLDSSKFLLKTIEFNNISSTNYSLVLIDATKMVNINQSSASTITIPINSSVPFPIGSKILVTQMGTGQITFLTDVGVTLNSSSNANKTKNQYSVATLIKTDTNTWLLFGDIIN